MQQCQMQEHKRMNIIHLCAMLQASDDVGCFSFGERGNSFFRCQTCTSTALPVSFDFGLGPKTPALRDECLLIVSGKMPPPLR